MDRTASPIVGIDRVHISGDGDDGSWNRGEISLSFGSSEGWWGRREEDKIASNSTVRLENYAAHTMSADAGGSYPWIAVVAGERDGYSLRTCYIQGYPDTDPDWRPILTYTYCNNARTMLSQTYVPSMTLAEIEQLPSCATFDVEYPKADRCVRVQTSPNSSEQVSFEFVAWYDLEGLD